MNGLETFDFNGTLVRAAHDGQRLWLVAKDVCRALDISWRGAETLSSIKEDWKGVRRFRTPGGEQDLQVINEPAVYKLAFRSNKPEAEAFTDWVAGEVIPAIMQTGHYELPAQSEGELLLRTGRVLYSQKCKICRSELAPQVNAMLGDPDISYDDIISWSAEQGLDISKAGLSRHNRAHRVPDAAPKALAENPEIAARIMLAKLTDLAQQRSLEGLSDRELVKYQTNLAVSLSRGLIASGPVRALPSLVDSE